jgi:secondary thiamine-phosphate synthase enzyme
MLRQALETLAFSPGEQGLEDISDAVCAWVADQQIATGLLTIFCRHTSASLVIHENASPAASRDLEAYFARIAPEDPGRYEHGSEGPDDMPAHLRTALTHSQLSIPVRGGRPMLGTWQGIFLFEHRREPHRREVALHLIGE